MHITLESDYAIRIVACLARENRRMDANNISANTDVTLRFALKILRKLVSGGLVRSFKGTHGGYELAKPTCQISMGDVIECIEGPMVISRCLEPSFCCNREHKTPCRFQREFAEVSNLVKQRLSQSTFDKLI